MSQKKVKGNLVDQDGNAFMLIGYFRKQARAQGFDDEFIESVTKEAESGDYDHLLQTLMKNMEAE